MVKLVYQVVSTVSKWAVGIRPLYRDRAPLCDGLLRDLGIELKVTGQLFVSRQKA